MRIRHRGREPRVHPTAYVAPSAVLSGDVTVGPETRVLHGAVITAEGAPVTIGAHCVVMENAVIRASGGPDHPFPTTVGDYTLIGPAAYLSGCQVGPRCFIAAGAKVFNGAVLKEGAEVTLGGIVHIRTTLEEAQWVPLQHVAIGTPCRIFHPGQTEEMMAALRELGFARYVFGVDRTGLTDAEVNKRMISRYGRALAEHREDVVLPEDEE